MKTDRPVALNLFSFRWPLAAMVSITHRVTGVVLFAVAGFIEWQRRRLLKRMRAAGKEEEVTP